MDLSKFLPKNWLINNWQSWKVFTIIILFFLFLSFHWILNTTNPTTTGLQTIKPIIFEISFKFLIIMFLVGILTLFWLYIRKLPINKKDKGGIAIAIKCESSKEKKRIKIDFINILKTKLYASDLKNIHIFELPEYYSSKLNDDPQLISNYINKVKAHLMLIGVCRIRKKIARIIMS